MKKIVTVALTITAFITVFAQNKENYLLVGTYTSTGKSEGIYTYKFNSETGEATKLSAVATSNPSYIAISPDQKFVYAVHEVDRTNVGGEISAFAFDKKTGRLTHINKQPSGGDHPCYIEVDKTGKWVFAGNYSSGSLSVFPVNKDGSLGKPELIQHTGTGKDPIRQDKPHVHCTQISPDNRWLFVPDLGIDKVMIYAFDAKTGKLTPGKQAFSASEPGAGPRHFTFHPNSRYAYLVEELSGHVVAFRYKDGQLTQLQRLSTKPIGQSGFAGSADIHVSPDGKFLYASNRGDFNSIAAFKIDGSNGRLTPIQNIPTLGIAPRNFNFDTTSDFLLVGNQQSDQIVVFKRDKKTGMLSDSGKRIDVGQPVCLKWISVK